MNSMSSLNLPEEKCFIAMKSSDLGYQQKKGTFKGCIFKHVPKVSQLKLIKHFRETQIFACVLLI